MKINQLKGRFTLINLLKVVGLIIVLLFLTGMCIGFADIWNAKQERSKVKEINSLVQSQGITENVKKLINDFIKKYPRTANIIICDAKGSILFKANDQIVEGKTTFDVTPDNREPGLYRMKNGYMRFMPIPKKIEPFSFMTAPNMEQDNHDKKGMNRDKRFSSSLNRGPKNPDMGRLFINSFNIGDDGMKIYYISGHFQENKMIEMLSITHGVVRILFLLFWVLLAVWVFKDSKARGFNKAFWGLLTLFTGLIGAAIYLIVIYRLRFCSICRHKVEEAANYCQECGSILKTKCSECGEMNRLDWNYCINCGKKKEEEA